MSRTIIELPDERNASASGSPTGSILDTSPGLRLTLAALQTQAQEIERLIGASVEALSRPQEWLRPDSTLIADIARNAVPRWHFAMLNDTERNEALGEAVRRTIPAGATVLDIGTGTGLLAMGAVRAGASHVYTCEANPLLAEIARQIIAEHGMSDSITVLNKRSTELVVGRELPRRVDVLISEIVDCGLIGEGLLPTVRHARAHLLAPGGVMMPVAARLYGQVIRSDAITGLNRVSTADGFDVSLMNVAATRGHFPVRLTTWPHETLSAPVELAAFDLVSGSLGPGSRAVSIPTTADGEAQALAVWFEMDLGAGITLRNAPENAHSHWMQALVPFEKPTSVTAGGRLDAELGWTDWHLSVS
ncbi:50S ribosomal protein L11 methyltransferase [Streptomyces stramineus]|uniref:Protein arginine N-methyltransferase domain-containing protein n=1 Tax=Streptomyces stramineus TaxID=173861 RepID=A0ABP3K2R8_9ACTN